MIHGIYGINIAVSDLKAATEKYEKILGVKPRPLAPADFAFPNLTGSEFNVGGVKINLIASVTEDTSIAQFIKKKGEGLFLISINASDIEKEIDRMKAGGAMFVSPSLFAGPYGKVNFIHPKSTSGVQFEVYEPAKK